MATQKQRHLLIDADVFAFEAASAVEFAWEFEDGHWTWWCNEDEVRHRIQEKITQYMDELHGDNCWLCLTDSAKNFRFDILSTYKGNRKKVKKPIVLQSIRKWLVEEKGALLKPRLEGDDVMGIAATSEMLKGEKIIVSIDKDMKTIPGLYCRDLASGIINVTEDEADRWHLKQTLSGDTTDGYAGCPGVGVTGAEKALREMTKVVPYEHEMKRGARKGEVETRYAEEETDSLWEVVLSRFLAAGLTEADAIQQARVARILRAEDYNFKTKEPIWWNPK
jgi:DNA polymerase-1